MLKKLLGLLIAVLMLTQPLYAIAQALEQDGIDSEIFSGSTATPSDIEGDELGAGDELIALTWGTPRPSPTPTPIVGNIKVQYKFMDGNSGVDATDPTYYKPGDTVTLLGAPTWGNNIFLGWKISGGTTLYAASGTYAIPPNRGNYGTITFEAQWQIAYRVTYDPNGGTGTVTDSQNPYPVGSTVTVLGGNGLVNTGFTFAGWKLGTTILQEGATFPIYNNITLKAQWTLNKYTVSFTAGAHGSLSGTASFGDISHGTPWAITVPAANGDLGYEFDAWSQPIPPSGTPITSSLSFMANFRPISYNITYNLDGGTNNAANPSTYNIESAITLAVPTKVGYRLVEWQENGVSTTGISAGSTGAKTFTAIWELDVYTLSYNLNGAVGTPPAPVTYDNGTTVSSLAALPAGVVNPGYTFDGWSLTPGGAKVTSVTINADTELYARWTPKTYQLSYNANGGWGSVPSTVSGKIIGDVVSVAIGPNPTRTGYTFLGWSEAQQGSIVDSVTFGASNIVLYAQWQIKTYTVTFYGRNNEILKTQDVNHGGFATAPDTNIYNGYEFAWWNKNYSNVTSNLAVKGLWLPILYSITYGGVDGAYNPNWWITAYTVEIPTITLAAPMKNGYVFTGWTPAGIIPQGSTGDKHFVANWEVDTDHDGVADKDEFRVTYNLNGGSGTTPVDNKLYSGIGAQSTFTAASQGNINRFGYVFLGWDTDGSATAASIAAGSTGNAINSTTGSVTLYAVWQANQYNITYILGEGGVNGANPSTYNVSTLPLTLDDPTRDGYVFVEWQDENQAVVTGIAAGAQGDKTFTAIWDEDTDRDGVADKYEYRVSYNLNGGGGTTPADTYLYSGITPQDMFDAAAQGDINRLGYTFLGWDTDGEATAAGVGAGSTGNAINSTTGNITLYAVWQLNQYNITYNLGEGGVNGANPATYNVTTLPLTLADPTRDGYVFVEWQDENEAAATGIPAGTVGDRAFTAIWEAINYTIDYELDGGALPAGQTNPAQYNVASDTITLNNPEREGYNFLGWTEGESTTPVMTVTIPTGSMGDLSFTAHWQIKVYTVTFLGLEGGALDSQQVEHGKGATAPIVPSYADYDFTGWDKAFNNITGDLVVTALYIFTPVVQPTPVVTPTTPTTPPPTTTAPTTAPTTEPTVEPSVSPEVVNIPDEEVPLNPAPVDEPVVEIPDEEVPLEAQPENSADLLTLVNLLAMIVTVIGTVVLVFKKTSKKEQAAEAGKNEKGSKHTGAKVISIIAAIGAIVFFFLTQPLKLMDIWDKYSVWQLLILAVYVVAAIVAGSKKKEQDKQTSANA